MKRRNTRKCDSFDIIRVSPKRASSHKNSISLRQPEYGSPTLHQNKNTKDKHYLQLPKIHAMHPLKLRRIQKQSEGECTNLQNRLLLLGYQYRKEKDNNRDRDRDRDKEDAIIGNVSVNCNTNTNNNNNKDGIIGVNYQYARDSKMDKQRKQKQRKRMNLLNKQNYVGRRTFFMQILASFGIAQVVIEKRKLLVFIQDGNNSRMVKQMLRKRPHLDFVKDKKQANFVWTRFCDYQCSKLTSKFYEEKSSLSQSHNQLHYDDYDETDSEHTKLSKTQEHSPPSTLSTSQPHPFFNNNLYPQTTILHSVAMPLAFHHHTLLKQCSKNGLQVGLNSSSPTSLSYSNGNNSVNTSSLGMIGINMNSSTVLLSAPCPTPSPKLIFQQLKYHNHFANHYQISDKKSLFINLRSYCKSSKLNLFELVPLTYQISSQNYELADEIKNQSGYWFIKPGQDTNRGNGISIAMGRDKVKQSVDNLLKIGKTAIVQQYIDPLLYRNRKFDIRCYALVMCIRGELKVYWYKQGYIRTCSKQFTYDITDQYAHLTNDAVQKKSPAYGKFQQSNKLSFGDLDNYLKSKEINFGAIQQQMKILVYHSIKSVQNKLKNEKNQLNFQIFGYDFLIDKKGKVWLIEINTNPCLQFTGSLTSRVIGHMIDNSFKIALDPLICNYHQNSQHNNGEYSSGSAWKQQFGRIVQDNKYQVII